jgi:hypothetical protein
MDPHQAIGAQDHMLLEVNTDARHRHWRVYQLVCLWPDGVIGAISTIRTLPICLPGRLNIAQRFLSRFAAEQHLIVMLEDDSGNVT